MEIHTRDHGLLKARYERLFLQEWDQRKEYLNERAGIAGFQEINYEGTRAIPGMGEASRSGAQRGGLKIEFVDTAGEVVAYVWMRGSGTEPVFRILADVAGSDLSLEDYLLTWQREMITHADAATV
jgi:phosphoglucomutase